MKHEAFGKSDSGKNRNYNEDAFVLDASLGLYLICDGLGGPPAGELACQTACTTIQTIVDQSRAMLEELDKQGENAETGKAIDMVTTAMQTAGRQVYKTLMAKTAGKGGCTIALLLLVGRYAIIAHIGDCRIYLIRDEQAHRITDDHARMVPKENSRGERKVLQRVLGLHEEVEVETLVMELMPHDIYMMTTDGLHDYFPDDDLANCCRKVQLGNIPNTLIRAANERGGKDNATVIVTRIESVRMSEVDPAQQVNVLKKIPLFYKLDYRELVQLSEVTRIRKYQDGELIIQDGEEGRDLFILLAGKARVSKLQETLAELTPGSFFGEGGLIEPEGRNADVIANGRVTAMIIGRVDLLRLLDEDPVMCTKVLWSMCTMLNKRLRHTTDHLSWVKSSI